MSEQVICLSDSDDEPAVNKESNGTSDAAIHDDFAATFDFPSVHFHYSASESRSAIDSAKKANPTIEKSKGSASSLESSNSASGDDNPESEVRRSRKEILNSDNAAPGKSRERPRGKKAHRSKNSRSEDTERIRAREQAVVDKRLKELEKRNRKNLQPGECMKFMNVRVDCELEDSSLHYDILDVLRHSDVCCQLESLPIPNSIVWSRRTESHYVNDSNEIRARTETQDENQILVVWKSDRVVKSIRDRTFSSSVASIVSLLPNRRLTLVVCGIEEYFDGCKKSKKQLSKEISYLENANGRGGSARISRYDLEYGLAEIQLTLGCNSALVETSQELAMLVHRYTKAIAEIPLKLEKTQKFADKIDWYAMGDNKDTVKVDKNGNGLKRLWQQQICQFNLAGLETAEAICSAYPSPRELMQAYVTCSPTDGEKLLKDIPIRRAAGPLSTARKIGPELSKKVFIMFTSKDGEETLGNVS